MNKLSFNSLAIIALAAVSLDADIFQPVIQSGVSRGQASLPVASISKKADLLVAVLTIEGIGDDAAATEENVLRSAGIVFSAAEREGDISIRQFPIQLSTPGYLKSKVSKFGSSLRQGRQPPAHVTSASFEVYVAIPEAGAVAGALGRLRGFAWSLEGTLEGQCDVKLGDAISLGIADHGQYRPEIMAKLKAHVASLATQLGATPADFEISGLGNGVVVEPESYGTVRLHIPIQVALRPKR